MKTLWKITTVLLLLGVQSIHAQSVIEDPYGAFAINLEDNLELLPQELEQVYTFKGKDYSIIAQKNVEPMDLEGMYKTAMSSLIDAGLSKAKPTTAVKRMKVNGNDAQMGNYISAVEYEGVQVNLHGMIMAIDLGETKLGLMSILSDESFKNYEANIQESYESIRQIGQELTGVTDVQEVTFEINDLVDTSEVSVTGSPTTVQFEEISMTLPAGWSQTPKNRSDSDMILGGFKNGGNGASCTLMGLKGLIWNRKSAIGVAEKSAASAFPGSQVLKNEDIKLGKKQKARMMVRQGQTVAQGNEVTLNMTFLTQKVGKYFVIYMMTNTPTIQDETEKALLSIAESAQM